MRCHDCHWFENAPPAGRKAKPCVQLAEMAQNQACDHFTEKIQDAPEPVLTLPKMEPDQVEGYIGALTEQKYRDIFHEIIAESFVLEQDLDIAAKTIAAQLQTQGANITAPADQFKRIADKLIELYVVYRTCNAVGLGAFAGEIMTAEIARKFKVSTT